MTLAAQARLGPYEILAPIGAGGMGTVYKARDTRLDRIVAIKVAQEKFSERFEREARVVAALNHPHICALYDVGPDYLVMEYIDGRPLSGPLSLDQSLKYAAQICEALDAAHRKGVVHRDLKPGNILVTKSGVKLLDFGLARIESSQHGDDTTFNPKLTQTGAVMGTPAYMSPEQWEGKAGDARSDIYAFGCVLYEMLTGKRAAEGRRDVEPATVESVLRVCLERDPEDRWQSARDMRRALQAPAPLTAPVRSAWRERVVWVSAVVIAIAVALFLAMRSGSHVESGAFVRRLSINLPPKTVFAHTTTASVAAPQLAASPDGQFVVFVAGTPGASPTVWLRPLDSAVARSLEGTDGAELPFWSPDGRWIGFAAGGKLKKIPAKGGPVVEITDTPEQRGASWGLDDTILFGSASGGVSRVPSSGGTVTRITERDRSREEGSHRFPQWLPDGQHFLFTVRSSLSDQAGVYAGSLDGKTKKLVLRGLTNAQYSQPGYILFMDRDTLMGQAFDTDRLETRGQPFMIETQVGRSSLGNGSFSAYGASLLAYAGPLSQSAALTWFDRSGKLQESVGPEGDYMDFRLSPDQTKLALSSNQVQTGFPDIWLMDLTRGVPARFASGPGLNAAPVWSPDSARIFFRTSRNGGFTELYSKSAGGGGKEEPVLPEDVARKYVGVGSSNMDLWDTDGRVLLFGLLGIGDYDLWTLPLGSDPKPVKFLAAPGHQVHGNFSPDGKLVAYSSNESGRWEIHVQTFPLSDSQWTISNGGYEPRWRADGREIYYLSEDRKLMVVTVNPGPSFAAPRELFQTRVPAGVDLYRMHYVPNRDGSRFLVNTQSGDPPQTPITVVLNWTQGLKKQ